MKSDTPNPLAPWLADHALSLNRLPFIAIWLVCALTTLPGQLTAGELSSDLSDRRPVVTVQPDSTLVLTTRSPGAEDIEYGFEGGTVVKVDGIYHVFTSEMTGDPFWVKMRLGHWISRDRYHWQRVATLWESSGDFTGRDPRAALWSPMVVWDEDQARWNLFYVAYFAEPNTGIQLRWNEKGRIYRAKSRAAGRGGINGPYDDVGIIMKPGKNSDPWEGLQGVDSFYAWKLDGAWRAFYGSCASENVTALAWRVGFATSRTLAGPWQRLSKLNPPKMDDHFIENPIVTKLPKGGWICVYDNDKPDAIGWTYSPNGIDWDKGRSLVIQTKAGVWAKEVRTPLGIVAEGGNKYTLFYSGFEQGSDTRDMLKSNMAKKVRCGIGTVTLELNR